MVQGEAGASRGRLLPLLLLLPVQVVLLALLVVLLQARKGSGRPVQHLCFGGHKL